MNAQLERPVMPLSAGTKQRVEKILARAAQDISFREQLLSDPDSALQDSDLLPEEISVLSQMRRVSLEEWGIDVRSFRAFLRDNGNKIGSGRK